MLVCEFLLEVLLKSVDFEALPAQLGQIPILGIWVQEHPVPPYCLAWAQKVLCCLPYAFASIGLKGADILHPIAI